MNKNLTLKTITKLSKAASIKKIAIHSFAAIGIVFALAPLSSEAIASHGHIDKHDNLTIKGYNALVRDNISDFGEEVKDAHNALEGAMKAANCYNVKKVSKKCMKEGKKQYKILAKAYASLADSAKYVAEEFGDLTPKK